MFGVWKNEKPDSWEYILVTTVGLHTEIAVMCAEDLPSGAGGRKAHLKGAKFSTLRVVMGIVQMELCCQSNVRLKQQANQLYSNFVWISSDAFNKTWFYQQPCLPVRRPLVEGWPWYLYCRGYRVPNWKFYFKNHLSFDEQVTCTFFCSFSDNAL